MIVGKYFIDGDECIYGEYGEMVDKKLMPTIEFPSIAQIKNPISD